jgi:hypothetical protein
MNRQIHLVIIQSFLIWDVLPLKNFVKGNSHVSRTTSLHRVDDSSVELFQTPIVVVLMDPLTLRKQALFEQALMRADGNGELQLRVHQLVTHRMVEVCSLNFHPFG